MNKKELVVAVTHLLEENDVRKHFAPQRAVLHISDDDGNKKDFVVKKDSTDILFNCNDVNQIVDAILEVVKDQLKHGGKINFTGVGVMGVRKSPSKVTRHPATGQLMTIPERYVPTFEFGKELKLAAKLYGLNLEENQDEQEVEQTEDGDL